MSDATGGPPADAPQPDAPQSGNAEVPPRYTLPGTTPAPAPPPPPPPPPPGYGGYPGYGPPPGYGGYGPPPGYGGYGPPPGYGGYGGYGPSQGWPGYGPAVLPKAGSAATGPLPLHPMTAGDVLDGIFKLLKANFRTIAIIVAVLVIPFHVLLAFLARNTLGGQSIVNAIRDPSVVSTANNSTSSQLLRYGTELVDVLLLPFIGGAIATVVGASYLGRSLTPGDALRATRRRAWSLLAAWWPVHLLEAVGLVFCVLPGLCVMALNVMIAPAIVIEDLTFWKGIQRSWNLVSRRFWHVLGIMLLATVIAYVVGFILGIVPEAAGYLVGLHWGWLLLALGESLTALIVTPIAAITATLLYYDARIRTEGFDLQVIAAGLARSDA